MEKLFKMLIATALLFTMIIPVNTFASGIQPLDMIGDDGGGTGTPHGCTVVSNEIKHTGYSHSYSGSGTDLNQIYSKSTRIKFQVKVICNNAMILITDINGNPVCGTGGYVTGTYTLTTPDYMSKIRIQYKGANANSSATVISVKAG